MIAKNLIQRTFARAAKKSGRTLQSSLDAKFEINPAPSLQSEALRNAMVQNEESSENGNNNLVEFRERTSTELRDALDISEKDKLAKLLEMDSFAPNEKYADANFPEIDNWKKIEKAKFTQEELIGKICVILNNR